MQRTIDTDESMPQVAPERSVVPAGAEAREATPDAPSPLGHRLMHAAKLAVSEGMELDAFMQMAWIAYVEARPGYREELELQQVIAALAEQRRLGRIGQA